MLDLAADHVGYVLGAYGLVALVLVVVVGYTVLQAQTLKRRLQALNMSDPGRKD
jgi:heme exporter protein CcmD